VPALGQADHAVYDTGGDATAHHAVLAAADKPAAHQPAAHQPAADKPAADKPAADKPAADEPAADEHVADDEYLLSEQPCFHRAADRERDAGELSRCERPAEARVAGAEPSRAAGRDPAVLARWHRDSAGRAAVRLPGAVTTGRSC